MAYRRRSTKRKAPRRKATGKGLTKVQKTQVKAIVAVAPERKYVSQPLTNLVLVPSPLGPPFGGFSCAITGTGEIYPALPTVYQGTDDHERIGNVISPKRVTLKLDIAVKSNSDNSAADRTVHIFILSAKSVKSLDNYTAIPITQLLNKGDGTNVAFDGTPFTAQYPVNTSEFTVHHHKAVRMVSGFGQAISTTAASAGATDGVICPSHSYARMSLNVPVPNKFKYDRQSQLYPTNSAPFMVIGFTNNNDRTSVPTDFVSVCGQVQMSYTDE